MTASSITVRRAVFRWYVNVLCPHPKCVALPADRSAKFTPEQVQEIYDANQAIINAHSDTL